LHSDAKIEVFYKPIGLLALVVFVLSLACGGVRINDRALASYVIEAGAKVAAYGWH
jgi:hypothetical protein